MPGTQLPLLERFWLKVEKSDGCWLWTGARKANGYGSLIGDGGRSGKVLYAHRCSWELAYGPIPDGLFVCHRCDNPPCVRPSHLFLGTSSDNNRDTWSKGRRTVSGNAGKAGEGNARAKVTEADVREIRRLYFIEGLRYSDIAAHFAINGDQVGRIVKGQSWSHIPF